MFRKSEGQSLVEFALVLPMMLAIVCLMINGGLLFFKYNALTSATRQGLRAASIYGPTAGIDTTKAHAALANLHPTVQSGYEPGSPPDPFHSGKEWVYMSAQEEINLFPFGRHALTTSMVSHVEIYGP